jgi:hypothetical protein
MGAMNGFAERDYRAAFTRWATRYSAVAEESIFDPDAAILEEGIAALDQRLDMFIESVRDEARFCLWRLLRAELDLDDELRFLSPELLFNISSSVCSRIDSLGLTGRALDQAYLLAVHDHFDSLYRRIFVPRASSDVPAFSPSSEEGRALYSYMAEWAAVEVVFGTNPSRGLDVLWDSRDLIPVARKHNVSTDDFVHAIEAEVNPLFLETAWGAGIRRYEPIITGFRLGMTVAELRELGGDDAFPLI